MARERKSASTRRGRRNTLGLVSAFRASEEKRLGDLIRKAKISID